MSGYSVVKYSHPNLLTSLAEGAHDHTAERISNKGQYEFLTVYLDKLNAETIVVEAEYVDHDFLEDYAAHYARCFQLFRRFCRRLHFFANAFTEGELAGALATGDAAPLFADMKQAYLGFIVVRPLPSRIIGRTCLATWPSEPSAPRIFPSARRYRANLFGVDLEVMSVAFQEQDRDVAVCATSALWSLFQVTGLLFQHTIPSPVEITRAATATDADGSRTLPNAGLSVRQQAAAIRSVGLDPLNIAMPGATHSERDATPAEIWDHLRAVYHAYSGLGIPLLISSGMTVLGSATGGEKSGEAQEFHAVAALGYRLSDQEPRPITTDGPVLTATRIDRIFVHDDQAGPFARLLFENGAIHTSLRQNGAVMVARPRHVLAPLYHKIRIPLKLIWDAVGAFDAVYDQFRKFVNGRLGEEVLSRSLEWDIQLFDVRNLKALYLRETASGFIDGRNIIDLAGTIDALLTRSMPKYIWRAVGMSGDVGMVEILFDATGLVQGGYFHQAFARHPLTKLVAKAGLQGRSAFRRSPDVLEIFECIVS